MSGQRKGGFSSPGGRNSFHLLVRIANGDASLLRQILQRSLEIPPFASHDPGKNIALFAFFVPVIGLVLRVYHQAIVFGASQVAPGPPQGAIGVDDFFNAHAALDFLCVVNHSPSPVSTKLLRIFASPTLGQITPCSFQRPSPLPMGAFLKTCNITPDYVACFSGPPPAF